MAVMVTAIPSHRTRLLNGFDTLTVQGYNVKYYYGYCRLLKGSYGY
jgi:hypothetical protein